MSLRRRVHRTRCCAHLATSAEFRRPAERPAYSVLDGAGWTAAGLPALPDWERSLRACLRELGVLTVS